MGGRHDAEFDEFVAARWDRLVRGAILLGCSVHEAEDLVQTALAKCLQHWGRVRKADDPDAYVSRIVVNTFIDGRRRRWRGELPTEQLPEVAEGDHTSQVLMREVIDRSLASLTTEQRIAVVLRYHLDLTEAQMAVVLGVPAGTVKSRLSRALSRLADDPSLSELRRSRA